MTTVKQAYLKGFVTSLVKRGQSFGELQRRMLYEQQTGQGKPMFTPEQSNTARAVGQATQAGYASEGDAWRGRALSDPGFAQTLQQNPQALQAADQNRPRVMEARLDPKQPVRPPTAQSVTPVSTSSATPAPAVPRQVPQPRPTAYRPPAPMKTQAPGRISSYR